MSQGRNRLLWLFGLLGVSALFAFWPKGGLQGPGTAGSGRSQADDIEARDRSAGGKRSRPPNAPALDPSQIPPLQTNVDPGEVRKDVGRNVFRFYDTPTPAPTRVPPTPTPFPIQGDPRFIGPLKPPPPPTPTPIVPPAIPYRVLGIFGTKERPIVALEEGGRLINARTGDVLDGRFIVRRINRESVDFAFVNLPNDITRRLPVEAGR